VKEARRRARLTLRQLAFPGCSAAYLSQIERGARTPSLQVLAELAARLDVRVEFLARGADGVGPAASTRDARHLRAPDDRAFEGYSLVLHAATTPVLQSWALVGVAQYALAHGDIARAVAALKDSLTLLQGGNFAANTPH
jgi:transcriptional regulator with XRE-family HTH domain